MGWFSRRHGSLHTGREAVEVTMFVGSYTQVCTSLSEVVAMFVGSYTQVCTSLSEVVARPTATCQHSSRMS
jgi:hypothetical protein